MILSIVVPAYNLEQYITPMLNSLLNQSEQQFEVIIVDDGSTDQTYNTAVEILSGSPSLHYRILRTDNRGVSAARNKGLSEAIGKYVMFLDGDDYVSHDLVHTIDEHTREHEHEPEMICWGYDLVRENKSTIVSFTSKLNVITGIEALNHIFIDKSLRVWTGSIAFKRAFLLENGIEYTERCVNGEDQEFIYKALSRAPKVISIPDVLSYYLQRSTSISNSYNVQKFDVVGAFKRVHEYFNDHPVADLQTISDLLVSRELTENYFFNLKTCLYGTEGIRIQDLLHDIDQAYPLLPQEMHVIMKHYKGDDKKLAYQIKVFLISPRFYHRLINLDRSLTHLKSRIKTVIKVQEHL
ncbi:glycosyltransferase family A protein [Paenibacillus sp. BR2-3]|uniref:glycosyltransferase family 2 protein n=1 Tax=Paenibacillus sp. BR2-3 TaxID=3048494 RepID=UPI0039774C2B